MFLLFYNLYVSMFVGSWRSYTWSDLRVSMQPIGNSIGTFLTSIFGDNQMTTLGDGLFSLTQIGSGDTSNWVALVSFILALITSIGIVVMAVKGIKRVFSVFFMGVR